MSWLKIKEGETINAIIDIATIKTSTKHWTGQRTELCLGQGCPHCQHGIPTRIRYQARLIGQDTYDWEFGEQVMMQLKDIPHETNFAAISITRVGSDRNTRYQISAQSEVKQQSEENQQQQPVANKYTRGEYGRFVKQ